MGQLEVTSEMYREDLMVKHYVHFIESLKRGTVVPIQWGCECIKGYLQPVIRLFNLTPEKDICIEHRRDPVKCFAEIATNKVLAQYNSVDYYQFVWLPILAMEAGTKTVSDGDAILCNNVPITLKKSNNDDYYGELKIDLLFCKKRSIKIFTNSKQDEDESNDYICIRYHTRTEKRYRTSTESSTSFIRNMWVGHAVAKSVSINDGKQVCLKFKIQHFNDKPPPELLSCNEVKKCTVEFLTKGLPDR